MEVDLFDNFGTFKRHFVINPELWKKFTLAHLVCSGWKEVKFYDNNLAMDNSMNHLPSDKGGIYVFIAKPNIVPETHLYIMYVGRALNTVSQNLNKRCKEYYQDTRPKIKSMRRHWAEYLYIRYLPLDDNQVIENLEKELINTILPPCNDKIPDKDIRAAAKAFE
jgi:hypothetical protein